VCTLCVFTFKLHSHKFSINENVGDDDDGNCRTELMKCWGILQHMEMFPAVIIVTNELLMCPTVI